MVDLTSLRILRSLTLRLVSFDGYRNFQSAIDLFSGFSRHDVHMLIDQNYSMDLARQDLDFIESLRADFELSPVHPGFEFKSDFLDEMGFYSKLAFFGDSGHKLGLVFCNFSQLKSEFTRELLYWDLMAWTQSLDWNLLVVNLENQPTSARLRRSIRSLMDKFNT